MRLFLQLSCRIAEHGFPGANRSYHHGTCTNPGAFADRNSGDDDNSTPNECLIFDGNSRIDLCAGADLHKVTENTPDTDRCLRMKDTMIADFRTGSNGNVDVNKVAMTDRSAFRDRCPLMYCV